MARKAIAGMLLLAIAAWAEMTLAPMLAMHSGLSRVGSAFAANGASQHEPHQHAAAQDATKHPCCPQARKFEVEGAFALVAADSGCQDSHRCCFRQGPQNVPGPVSEARQLGQQPLSTMPTPAVQSANGSDPTFVDTDFASPPYPQTFGMTLRI